MAKGNMTHVNLRPEAISAITKLVEDTATKYSTSLTKLVDELNKISADAAQDRLCHLIGESVAKIEEVKTATINPGLTDWKDNAGFAADAIASGSGDSAKQTGAGVDSKVIEILSGIKPKNDFKMPSDLSKPKLEDHHYDEIERAFEECMKSISDETTSLFKNIAKKAEEDVTYGVLLTPINLVGNSYTNLAKELVKKSKEFKTQVGKKSKVRKSANTDKAIQAKTTTASAGQIASALSMFDGF